MEKCTILFEGGLCITEKCKGTETVKHTALSCLVLVFFFFFCATRMGISRLPAVDLLDS